MKVQRIIQYFLVLALIVSQTAFAQVGLKKLGQSTMNFLLVNVSPRAGAMGETFIAVGEGAESIFFNPAGIVETSSQFDLKIAAAQWIADINYMADALVWNAGNLANGSEKVQLSRPAGQEADGTRNWIRVDRVVYSDGSRPQDFPLGTDPWPAEADGQGQSLTRIDPTAYGNDPINWTAAAPSPGQ